MKKARTPLLRILHLPLVSKKEQQDINKLYKAPSRRAVRSVYVRAALAR